MIKLSGHHLKDAGVFLSPRRDGSVPLIFPGGRRHIFFSWFFSHEDKTPVSIVAGQGLLCSGWEDQAKCSDYVVKNGYCRRDLRQRMSPVQARAHDTRVARVWGFPVGSQTTIGVLRDKLMLR